MNRMTDQTLEDIFHKLQSLFPFHGYCDRTMLEEVSVIVRELRKFLPDFERRRLLDIGSGPMDKTAMFKFLAFSAMPLTILPTRGIKEMATLVKLKSLLR